MVERKKAGEETQSDTGSSADETNSGEGTGGSTGNATQTDGDIGDATARPSAIDPTIDESAGEKAERDQAQLGQS